MDTQGTVTDENFWIRSMSNDTYLWYDEIVDVDPGEYADPLTYFSLMRTFALTPSGRPKDQFHFTYDSEEWRQLSQSGVVSGYGAIFTLVRTTPPRQALVAYIEADSPAATAGLTRGTEILEVDGVNVASGNADVLNSGLFPVANGESHTFLVQAFGAAEPHAITMVSQATTTDPVPVVATIETDTGKVGYLQFNDHIATAESKLIDAITLLGDEQVTDLILDVRYNGGGFLSIANELAYMIGGTAVAGQVFYELEFNDKHPFFDPVTGGFLLPTRFRSTAVGFLGGAGVPLPTLSLPRVFVLTGGGTCSASEAIINGLNGVNVEVIQIGNSTCGKPFGFYPLENCGTTYFTIQFRSVNARGFGDFADGFSPGGAVGGAVLPGCSVPDDYSRALGDPEELRLAAALEYRATGTCPEATGFGTRRASSLISEGVTVKPLWLKSMTLRATPFGEAQ